MPADNNNEETGSQEALSSGLEQLKQIVSNNGFSKEQKEAFLGQFKEIEQVLSENSHNEGSQRVSLDGPEDPARELQEVLKALKDQLSRNSTSPQKSNDPREAAVSWIQKFSAFIFAVILLGILIIIIVAIFITKSFWLAPLSLILLLVTKPFLRIVNFLYPLDKKESEVPDKESNESSLRSQIVSTLAQFFK